jgi:phosphatidylglycerol lysyltransferase
MIRPLMGLATGLAGLANMLSAIVPRPNWDLLLGAWPVEIHHGVHKLIVVVGFFLIMLSYGLMRGKYGAWCLAVLLFLLSVLLHILSVGQVLATILTAVFIALLAACFRCFQAKSDIKSCGILML